MVVRLHRRLRLPLLFSFLLVLLATIARLYATQREWQAVDILATGTWLKDTMSQDPISKDVPTPEIDSPRVHLLIPGNEANKKICRTMASAIVNDYPTPVLINWGRKKGDKDMNGYDMTTGKNWGVLKYLRSLPASSRNDLVLMVDAHDVVLQLPLDIAIKRYESVNRRANSRILLQHGEQAVQKYKLKQTIVMGAEKHCWPLDHKHPACWAVPTSPLRPDTYGIKTDRELGGNRPRWLNSGNIMGPVGDLIEMYEWAHKLWMAYDAWGGDQDYFSNIYGRQELSRQRLRGSKEWVFGFGEHIEEKDLWFPNMEVEHKDYHLGVDLDSQLFQSLNDALGDLSSVVHSNTTDMAAQDAKHETAKIYNAEFPFPQDLANQPMPDESRQGGGHSAAARWQDVRLFTNFHARSIPAILHHNGDKSRLDSWWQRQWWTGHGRNMVDLRMKNPSVKIRTDSEKKPVLSWHDVCSKFEGEVFVDPVASWE